MFQEFHIGGAEPEQEPEEVPETVPVQEEGTEVPEQQEEEEPVEEEKEGQKEEKEGQQEEEEPVKEDPSGLMGLLNTVRAAVTPNQNPKESQVEPQQEKEPETQEEESETEQMIDTPMGSNRDNMVGGAKNYSEKDAYNMWTYGELNEEKTGFKDVKSNFTLKSWHENMKTKKYYEDPEYDIKYVFDRYDSNISGNRNDILSALEGILDDSLNFVKNNLDNDKIINEIKKHHQIIELILNANKKRNLASINNLVTKEMYSYKNLNQISTLFMYENNDVISRGIYNLIKEVIINTKLNQDEILGQLCELMTKDDIMKELTEVKERCNNVYSVPEGNNSSQGKNPQGAAEAVEQAKKEAKKEAAAKKDAEEQAKKAAAAPEAKKDAEEGAAEAKKDAEEAAAKKDAEEAAEEGRLAEEAAEEGAAKKAAEEAAAKKAAEEARLAEEAKKNEEDKKADKKKAEESTPTKKTVTKPVTLSQGAIGMGSQLGTEPSSNFTSGGSKKTKKNKRGGSSKKRRTLKKFD